MIAKPWTRCLALAALMVANAGTVAQAAPRVVDVAGSQIGFSVSQMGVEVSGRFSRFEGEVDFDAAKPDAATARISVDIASLSTGDADADAVALEAAWLDQAAFPQARFVSSGLKALGGDRYQASGTLTLRGKARPLSLPLTITTARDGTLKVVGTLKLQRSDFGIGGGEWNEGDLVANTVPVNFSLRLTHKP